MIFVSKLYPGSISDKELTRQSGLLDLLERDNSIMAYKAFYILEDLAPHRVRLNIPPFLLARFQLERAALSMARPSLNQSVVNHSCRHSLSHSTCSACPTITPAHYSMAISMVHMANSIMGCACSSIVMNILINAHALLAINSLPNYLFE